MNIKIFNQLLQARSQKLKKLIRDDLPRIIGEEAKEHFIDNFRQGGFVNNGLQKWTEVKRRDPASSWYGFDYKGEQRTHYAISKDRATGQLSKSKKQTKLNFSKHATEAPVLTSRRNLLMNSIKNIQQNSQATIRSSHPGAKLHNEGGSGKVFGKHAGKMPQRQFIGHSTELNKKVTQELIRQVDNFMKK